ncbi:MAG: DUF2284 domain-containing protein [bacterium]|nr:DUF2284 domain-containing protein [bacterium]
MGTNRQPTADELKALAIEVGFSEAGMLDIPKLKYEPLVRQQCEKNDCGRFAKTWTCPPGVGTLEECKERVEGYGNMMLFNRKYELEDEFDFEGMIEGLMAFKELAGDFDEALEGKLEEYRLLSNEGCEMCETCTYPDAPCRFPDKVHHSLTSYGFTVAVLAKMAGMTYNNGPGTVTYFGALLFK